MKFESDPNYDEGLDEVGGGHEDRHRARDAERAVGVVVPLARRVGIAATAALLCAFDVQLKPGWEPRLPVP